MSLRKIIIRSALLLLLLLIIVGIRYAWRGFPIISGYGSKNLASGVYLQHRNTTDVIKEDLAGYPLFLGTYSVNEKDSSVTGSVWGFAKRKTIYRPGLGCTIINDFSEAEIRAQLFELAPRPDISADILPWPYGDKLTDSVPAAINKVLLEQAINNAMQATSKGKPSSTRSVLVIYDGKIVGEQYAPGFNKNTLMLGWSMSKTLTAAMIGVLVKDGKLNVDAPAPVPEWKNTDKGKITIKQLLQQTSGIDFNEDYANPSEVTNMLFKYGDMAAFTATLPLLHKPGTIFNYSSGNANLLSRIIRQTVGERDYAAFPNSSLFYKINIYSMILEPDASGTYIGSSYSYATTRDFARFGLFYYNNGVWNGQQILPLKWVQESAQPSAADKQKHYGYQCWLNGFSEDLTSRLYPDVPPDMFFADGYGGQGVFIIPSKKLVVVRFGLHPLNENQFLKEVIQSIKE